MLLLPSLSTAGGAGLCLLGLQYLLTSVPLAVGASTTGNSFYVDLLYNGQPEASYEQYSENGGGQHVNLPYGSLYAGHLFEPQPPGACAPLPHPPPVSNATWFLLVSDYPACPLEMISKARSAGYSLIIAFGNGNNRNLPKAVLLSDFPVISIDIHYGRYLSDNALSSTTDDPITVRVEVLASVHRETFQSYTLLVFVPFVLLCVCLCVVYARQNHQLSEQLLRHQRRHQEQELHHQLNQEVLRTLHHGRSELTESIEARLALLNLDRRTQRALGAEEIKQLLVKPYCAGGKGGEECVICYDEFSLEEMVKVLPCGHNFHPECVDEWLSKHSSLCPHCKENVRVGRAKATTTQQESDNSEARRQLIGTTHSSEGEAQPQYGTVQELAGLP